MCNRVLFVERSGELRRLARLSTHKVRSRRETECEERVSPARGVKVSRCRPETG